MTTFSLLCAVFDMFKGKVICRPIHLDAPAKIYTSCLPLEIYFHSKNVLCFFFVCVQRRRRKQTSPSTRKGRQWRCTHSPGEKDRGARKGTFLCIYHQDGAACPTLQLFTQVLSQTTHLTWTFWSRRLSSYPSSPIFASVCRHTQSALPFARGRNVNISSCFRWLSAIF